MAFVSSFTGAAALASPSAAVTRRRAASTTRMGVLDGLDKSAYRAYTNNKVQPYEFSRYILGPFTAVRLPQNPDVEDKDASVAAMYRQIFGNAYIMEEEKAEVAYEESQFRLGALSAREFARSLAKTKAYQKRFFDGASNYRFIELNHKHFLGRAPDSYEETSAHSNRLIADGYDAEIDSYFDCDEYFSVFGDDSVPFLRFRGAYTPCDSFNRQCALEGGWANSDKAMGGAAITGYNGADGQQSSELLSSYMAGVPVPAEKVYRNTPLKTTAPNWYSVPDTNVPEGPKLICQGELDLLAAEVDAAQAKYATALEQRNSYSDVIDTWRSAAKEVDSAPGFVYGGSVSYYGNALPVAEGPLAEVGLKTGAFKKYGAELEANNVSRAEADLEAAKRAYMVAASSFDKCTPAQRAVAESLALASGKILKRGFTRASASNTRPKIVA